jgi:hypothetical protein
MSNAEQTLIADLKHWVAKGYIDAHELAWCVGAIKVRHGLTKTTRMQLKETVQVIVRKGEQRWLADLE